MIIPGNTNPSLPTPGVQVCIPFTATGGGAPSAVVTHQGGGVITPSITANAHPSNSYTLCFTWPPGNTTSDVTIVVGNESITFTVAGSGGV